MVPLTSLVLPIVIAAVLVFVASSIIHMFTTIHRNDVKRVPSEDEVMAALRPYNIPPGDYVLPHVGSSANMKNPDVVAKLNKGPVVFMTVMPTGVPGMGSSLVQWFLYCILISVFAGYLAGRALAPGAEYLEVFRFAGTAAFAGYALALMQNSIWWKRDWVVTLKNMVDGLVYGLLTAGAFGWLWPA
jgi:hypothetical protein